MSVQQPASELNLDPGVTRIRQRLRALRSRYAGVALTTELTHIHDDQVVVRAVISFPDGTAVSAFAAEPTDSTGLLDGALELAEQRATARALDLLGVGDVPAQSRREAPAPAEEAPPTRRTSAPEPAPPVVRPDEVHTPPVVEALRRGTGGRGSRPEPEAAPSMPDQSPPAVERPVTVVQSRPQPPVEDPPQPEPTPRQRRVPDEAPPSPERTARPPAPSPSPPSRPAPVATAAADDDDLDMADYTWTHFWTWARGHDLSTKGQVEQRIGRSIDGQTPQDVRQWLHDAGVPR